jgi:hypothetical protein
MRKGVADLHRCAELSQRSNERYLEALDVVENVTPCARLFDAVARPVVDDGRRFRALRIGDQLDLALLEAISRSEFVTAGFRNRDLRKLLYPSSDALSRRNSVVSQPKSAVSFASSARTESSRRSPRRTATNSPNAAVSLPQHSARRQPQ